MFELRVKVLLGLLSFALAIIAARLIDMQVIHAAGYVHQADDALLLPAHELPAVRGRILDRSGRELAADEPCWDVKVDYGILAMDPEYLRRRADDLFDDGYFNGLARRDQAEPQLRAQIDRMWRDFARFSGEPLTDLHERADTICERIGAVREAVEARLGYKSAVREERMAHAVLEGFDDQQQIAAREVLGRYPWVHVVDSTRRRYHAGVAFAHLLGRLAPVSPKVLRNDPNADDDLARYKSSDHVGVTGVERAAESLLRGRRGRLRKSRTGDIMENVPPENGADVHVTIRSDLQQKLYDLFGERIEGLPYSTGGAIAVLDVASRELLALVSYPGFDPNTFRTDYRDLRADTRRQPLRFRAVANSYAPGSVVKPLICLAGLNSGKITLDTRFTCQGALFPDHPDQWRCWRQGGTDRRMHHGSITAEEAIMHSCNVFMYQVGELVGVQTLTNYFDYAGFGKPSGTGLVEEVEGINPDPGWLAAHDVSITHGLARLFAIGQGQVSATPLQVANLMAVYASGRFRNINLIREQADPRVWTLPGDESHWRAVRRGIFRVVNDAAGTAHRTACLDGNQRYALCGKTGSAQAIPWPVSYEIKYVDSQERERSEVIDATTRRDAIADFLHDHPDGAFSPDDVKIKDRWPPVPPEQGDMHSHAWFAGFLQETDGAGHLLESADPKIAFAVLVEFGGSGGHVAAPIGKRVAELLIEMLGPDLDPDALTMARSQP